MLLKNQAWEYKPNVISDNHREGKQWFSGKKKLLNNVRSFSYTLIFFLTEWVHGMYVQCIHS